MSYRHFLGLAVLAFLAAVDGASQPQVRKLEQRVTDYTGILDYAQWRSLETQIKAFEDSTSTQVAVLVVGSTGETPIEEFSIRVFEANAIGQKGKDNGVLVVLAVEDRAVRIEVGYGLEGVLPDAAVHQIIERQMMPRFREGEYYLGLSSGLAAIFSATAGEYRVESDVVSPSVGFVVALLFVAIIFLFVLFPAAAARRRTVIGSRGWYSTSGWGLPTGGWGGGTRGGFGGGWSGGGGMAGGGGATGRW